MLGYKNTTDRSHKSRLLSGTRLAVPVIGALLLAGCVTTNSTTSMKADAAKTKVADTKVLALAEEALEERRFKDAKSLIQNLLVDHPKNKKAQVLWAELLVATGTPRAAIQYFDANAEDPILGARALQGRGLAHLWSGNSDTAKADLEESVARDPAMWRAWNALGYHYDTLGDWKNASNAYARAIDINRNSAILYNNRGYSRFLQRKIKAATKDFSTALRLDPQLEVAQLNLRLAVAWSGEYERAILGTEKKDLPRILNNVGYVALVTGDLNAAEGLLVRAVEADSTYNVTARKNLYYLNSIKKAKKEAKK